MRSLSLASKQVVCAFASMCAIPSLAAPFNTLDTRAMGMGDTGVASAHAESAVLFNPALLSNYTASPKVAMLLPGVGANAFAGADVDDALEAIDEEQYLEQLSNNILNLNRFTLDSFQYNATEFSNTAVDLVDNLSVLKDRPFNIQGNVITSLAMPDDELGWSIYYNANAVIETVPFISDCDLDVLLGYTEFFSDITIDKVVPGKFINASCNEREELLPIVIRNEDGIPEFVDPLHAKSETTGVPYLVSSVEISAVAIQELGFSLSHKFSFSDYAVSIGFTPKYMNIVSYYTNPTVQQIDDGSFDLLDALRDNKRSHNAVNIDVGIAMNFLPDQSITLGMVAKNLIQQRFQTATFERPDGSITSNSYNVNTQVRLGFAYRAPFGMTISSDIDLTDNKPYFTGVSTQYFGAGAEFDIFNILDLRIGGRTNFSNTDDSVITGGFGLNILVVRFDVGAEYGSNNAGLSAQMAVAF